MIARAAIVLALLLASLASRAHAQVQATVVMRADRTEVQVGDVFQLEVRADVRNADRSRVELPDLDPFDVVARQVSSPVQIRFGFGSQARDVQSTTIHRLTLRARQPGTFELRPAVVHAGRSQFRSNALTITVGGSAGGVNAVAPDPNTAIPLPPATGIDDMVFDPEGFVRTVVDQSQPFVGQQTTVTIYLYMREDLRGNLQITQEPTFDGFWTQDLLPPSRQLAPEPQHVRGYDFGVYLLRRIAAFPLRAGELTIGPTGVSVSGATAWDIFTGGGGRPLSRTGVPVTVRAQELPAPRPDGNVHVGRLELEAALDRASVPTGEAAQLTVTARGVGQMSQIALALPPADGLRVLAPEIDDRLESPGDVVGGTRTMRWLIVPERAGSYPLGPFEVNVFDPLTRQYSVARTAALRLEAAGNPVGEPDEPAQASSEQSSAPQLTLAPLRTRSALTRSRSRLIDSPWLALAFALGPLVLIGGALTRAVRRRAASADPSRAPKRAQREAKKRLSAASKHAAANEPREFYGAIAQSLKDVLEAKLGRAVGSFTHAELRRYLGTRGMDEALAESVVDELEGCDFARFSAVGVGAQEMEGCLSRVRALLEKLDRFTPREEER